MRPILKHLLCAVLIGVLHSPLLLAQHATAFDIVDGQQAFQLYCANCHGPDGDLIANVDLGHGNFRQPYTDAQLTAIIINGISSTPMPATPGMGEEQAQKIVAYLRSLAINEGSTLAGDAIRGKILFDTQGECLSCHSVAGKGARLGPELTRIGLLRSAAELTVSLLSPNQEVQANNRFVRLQTHGGETVTGRLLNQDSFNVQLLDENERLRSFSKEDLESFNFIESLMPSLSDSFAEQEIADLVEYLASLRGVE